MSLPVTKEKRIWPWILGSIAAVFLLEWAHLPFTVAVVNPLFWALSNATLAYFFLALLVYVLTYSIKFKWRWIDIYDPNDVLVSRIPNQAGRLILAFTSSLLAVAAIIVIGVFVNPRQSWLDLPDQDLFWWRPTLRLLIFLGVSVTITAMDYSLWRRIFRKEKLGIEIEQRPRVLGSGTGPLAKIIPKADESR